MVKQTVFVGMSGGVDSSVSAALLKEAGYEVVGVFMRTWHPDFLECNEEEERRDAMRVAAHLDIPFLTFDFEKVYKKEVADYMIAEYKKGRTPNPDVMCNKEVKFGVFLKKSLAMGADHVATGHYAVVNENIFPQSSLTPSRHRRDGTPPPVASQKIFSLLKNKDNSKDQSYFLWTLKQKQLNKILFPIGNFKKTEVRKIAKKYKLPVAEKKDSQGICFLGAIDLKNFLKHYIKEKRGKVVNEQGETIGYHSGVVFYTLGERHGFTITEKSPNDRRHYVIGKDIKKNILYVNSNKDFSNSIILTNYRIEKTNWISEIPKKDKTYTAQIRYHGEFLPCTIKCGRRGLAQVVFKKPVIVAGGQSCVVYDGDACLGGGVIV